MLFPAYRLEKYPGAIAVQFAVQTLDHIGHRVAFIGNIAGRADEYAISRERFLELYEPV